MARRIRRVGLDTIVNYTLQATSAYNASAPAATTSSWGTAGDVALMDRPMETPSGTVDHEGALVTFARFPHFFNGAYVKLLPTFGTLEDPAIELWTQDATTLVWTKRRRVSMANIFTGTRSDVAKVFNLTIFSNLTNVGQVWITMDPSGGTPTNRFIALHLFGECEQTLVVPNPCDVEDDPNFCDLPPPGTPPDPGSGPPDDPAEPPPVGPPPGPPWPPPIQPPPDEPPIDLCDAEAVDAFKKTLTPEQLAYFEELLASLELPCLQDPPEETPDGGEQPKQPAPINCPGDPTRTVLPGQPCEIYFDPTTGNPDIDPRDPDQADPPEDLSAIEYWHFFFFYNNQDKASFLANLTSESAFIQDVVNNQPNVQMFVFGSPADGSLGTRQTTRLDRVEFDILGAGTGAVVGLKAMVQNVNRNSIPFIYNPFSTPFNGPVIDKITGFHPLGWALDTTNGVFGQEGGDITGYKTYKRTDIPFRSNILAIKPNPTLDNPCHQGFLGLKGLCTPGIQEYLAQVQSIALYVSVAVQTSTSFSPSRTFGSAFVTPSIVKTESVDIVTGCFADAFFGCTGPFTCVEIGNYLVLCPN